MLIIEVLSRTPVWVWVLFAYLILRGVKALHPREVSPARALLIPVIFLVWALSGIHTELSDWSVALVAFAFALVLGLFAGWWNAARLPAASFNLATGKIGRPGSAVTLVLVILAFIAKYILSVALAMHPQLAGQSGFAVIFGGISGLVDGVFWGGTIQQFRTAFASRAASVSFTHTRS